MNGVHRGNASLLFYRSPTKSTFDITDKITGMFYLKNKQTCERVFDTSTLSANASTVTFSGKCCLSEGKSISMTVSAEGESCANMIGYDWAMMNAYFFTQ